MKPSAVVLAAVALLCPALARAAVLDATTSLNTLTNPIPLEAGTQNVAVNGSSVYDFRDRNGDGTLDDPVAPVGLSLGGFALNTSDATSISLNLNDGNITGDSAVKGISTFRNLGGGSSGSTGSISIVNAGNLSLGIIDTGRRSTSTSSPTGAVGNITIGEAGDPVGTVRVDALYANNYNTADINDGRTYSKTSGGSVTVYGTGNVQIQDSSNTLGHVVTWSHGTSSGLITIQHDGEFRAAGVLAMTAAVYSSSGKVGGASFNGDAAGNGPSGNFYVAGDMQFYYSRTTYGGPNGHVTITGYNDVYIGGDILTYNDSATNGVTGAGRAGNFTVTAAGDITIVGLIDMHRGRATSTHGTLDLAAGGTIYLNDLDLDLLAMAKLGSFTSQIQGVLSNFTGNDDPRLRTYLGGTVYYDPDVVGNEYLNGQTYSLLDLGGNSTGILTPVPEPTTLALLALGGLSLSGASLRRRR